MTIRPITENDIESCARIFTSAYNQLPWNYKWEQDKAIKYLKEYLISSGFMGFVVCNDDKIVAAILGHTKTWWTNDQLVIDELFVSLDSQGQGYGKKLMEYCEQYCKDKGIEMVNLMTNKFMPAYNFYINNDYIKVDQYVFMFKQI